MAYLTSLSLLMDIITVMAHYNFYGLLVLLFVASIFLLNYFDRVYIRFIFFNLIISMILDAIWLAMKFDVIDLLYRITGDLRKRLLISSSTQPSSSL